MDAWLDHEWTTSSDMREINSYDLGILGDLRRAIRGVRTSITPLKMLSHILFIPP
jgi:hypothetical protein